MQSFWDAWFGIMEGGYNNLFIRTFQRNSQLEGGLLSSAVNLPLGASRSERRLDSVPRGVGGVALPYKPLTVLRRFSLPP